MFPRFRDRGSSQQVNLEIAEDENPWAEDIAAWLDQPINRAGPHHSIAILRGAGVIPLDQPPDGAKLQSLPKAMEQVGGWKKDRDPTRHNGQKARFWRKVNVPGGGTNVLGGGTSDKKEL